MPAQPFCPIDDPNVAAKLAIPSGTPRRLVCVCTFNGKAPALERDVNAKINTSKVFLT